MKKLWFAIGILIASVAAAGTIKTFVNGETLTAADLNAVLQHIHGTMVGGHGARLVNADVNASAAIAHSKLATPALVPKAWAQIAPSCGASPCASPSGFGVASITRTSAGLYTVTWTTIRPNDSYVCFANGGNVDGPCRCGARVTSSVTVECFNNAGVATDAGFDILMLDNDN